MEGRSEMPALLNVKGLSVAYGAIRALQDVSLQVNAGEAVAILGANGAGKSTLLRAISGLIRARAGTVEYDGLLTLGKRPAQIARLGLVHVPEGRQVFARLTVRDNLHLGAFAHTGSTSLQGRLDEVLEIFPRLAERLDQVSGTLSGGEQQMLAIGRGLMARPRLLMLDEPSMGLSPLLTRTIFKALEVVRDRTAVLVVEQNVRAALAFATRGYLLESGQVIASGNSAELSDESIRAAYLGRG